MNKKSAKKKFFDWRLFFSFKGRINRLKFLGGLFTIWGIILLVGIVLVAFLPKIWTPSHRGEEFISIIYEVLGYIFVVFAIASLYAKRSHDLNWSAWYVFLLLIPGLNFVYAFRIFFKSGTLGDNRFGPDPLGRKNFIKNEEEKTKKDASSFTICSSCGSKCDDSAFDCPNCGEKFWQNREAYEKFLESRKMQK